MALVPIDLKVLLYSDPEGENLYLRDTTDQYSVTNLGGYGRPAGATSNSVDTVTVTLTYTLLEQDSEFVFTVLNGVITAATLSFAGATPVNILSDLPSTSWPFTSANPLNLTSSDYGVDLPDLEDMVYEVSYQVEGTYLSNDFDYTAEDQVCFNWATYCCISKALLNADMSETSPSELSKPLIAEGYMLTAIAANGDGLTDKSNDYLTRAKALCEEISNCGCN